MRVHYLCHPPQDTIDFVYAAELPDGYYSPGIFCVEATSAGGLLAKSFQFPARLGQRLLVPSLSQVAARTYAVDVNELAMRFFFKIVSLDRTSRYVGRESERFADFPLFRVQPANAQRLERACIRHDFFFVGFGAGNQSEPDEIQAEPNKG